MLVQKELKNAYIGMVKEFTLSAVPDWDVNTYINIAQSWFKVTKVTMKYTCNVGSHVNTWARISWNNNTTDRYWLWFTHTWSTNLIQITWHINNASDTIFYTTSRNTGTNYVEFIMERGTTTIKCSWANTLNYSYTQTTAEKNIVETIMNSATINCYASRQVATLSDVEITVGYEPIS